jgi:ABC-type antimicrobial peptide transport system permease subunit
VIKAIGSSNLQIMVQFMTEAITLTALGSVIGIGLGALAGSPITRLLVNNSSSSSPTTSGAGGFGRLRGLGGGIRTNLSSIHAAVGWSIILYGLGAAVLIAIVGSTIASYFISKVRPAEVMRAE